MVKLVVVLAALAVGFVVLQQRAGPDTGLTATAPQVDTTGVPEEFRTLLAKAPDPAALLRERGALPGLGAIRDLVDGDDPAPAATPRPFADVGTRRELKRVRRDIRRDLALLNRAANRDAVTAERALAQVYSASVLARLGPDGRRRFAERVAGHTQAAQRIKVLDFEGIFVSGRRALAQVVYRISTRSPSGRFVARSPAVWTVTLARENGRWRFVQGFE
jgi:hypothetical protein